MPWSRLELFTWISNTVTVGIVTGSRMTSAVRGSAHMDIKPANTLLKISPDGTGKVAKLADFGLSIVAFEIVEDRSRVRSINEHRQLLFRNVSCRDKMP